MRHCLEQVFICCWFAVVTASLAFKVRQRKDESLRHLKWAFFIDMDEFLTWPLPMAGRRLAGILDLGLFFDSLYPAPRQQIGLSTKCLSFGKQHYSSAIATSTTLHKDSPFKALSTFLFTPTGPYCLGSQYHVHVSCEPNRTCDVKTPGKALQSSPPFWMVDWTL